MRIEFSLPRTAIPTDSVNRDLSIAFWDGTRWTTVSDSATNNADGSIKLHVWLTSGGIYAVVRAIGAS